MKLRKTLSILLALVMILGISGSAMAATELVFWDMVWGGADAYIPTAEKLVEQFNEEHPDIHVTYQSTAWQNFYQTFLTAVTAGVAPDVSTGAFPQAVQYAQMGEITDLSSILEEWQANNDPILDDFVPGILEMERYEGVLAGIPWNMDPRQIWYNKDAFDQAGITEMPTTWDEFLECCRLIKENTDFIPFNFAGGDHMATQFSIALFAMNDAGWSNSEGTGAFEDKQKIVESFEFLGELVKNGYVSEGIAGYIGADADLMFYSEKVAMYWSSPLNGIGEYPELIEKVFALPAIGKTAESAKNYVWPNYVMSFSQTEHPEESKIFLKWWVENCQPLYYVGELNSMPALNSTMQNEFYADKKIAKEIRDVVLEKTTTPVSPAPTLYLAFSQIEGETIPNAPIQAILTGATNYDELAEKLLADIQDAFDDNAE
ncbi:sugar ABC transporter substrate-binding protein [Eubacteriales bacterium OttesenSCG-928-N13]|nr:sugar ABC transporter substrate-binding protein [Eubacteriales bacterium OttesenSCG-928-N13]